MYILVTALGVTSRVALPCCFLTLLATFFLPSHLSLNVFALIVCLTLLASFFLPCHLSLNMYTPSRVGVVVGHQAEGVHVQSQFIKLRLTEQRPVGEPSYLGVFRSSLHSYTTKS